MPFKDKRLRRKGKRFNTVAGGAGQIRRPHIDAQGRTHADLTINGKKAWLNRVFVKIEGKKAGLIPDVRYVELFGTDPQTGAAV